jgi:hypothetical protein
MHIWHTGWYLDPEAACNLYTGINARLEHALLEGFHVNVLHISKITAQWPCSFVQAQQSLANCHHSNQCMLASFIFPWMVLCILNAVWSIKFTHHDFYQC